MINSTLANQLNNAFSSIPDLNMQIIDINGTVLTDHALSDIGKYHPAAHKLMMGAGACLLYQMDTGDLDHVFQAIHVLSYQSSVIGAICLTGHSEEVKVTAAAIAVAMNNMLAVELSKKGVNPSSSKSERFYQRLLGQELCGRQELELLAKELGYKPELLRIPLLIQSTECDMAMDELVQQLKLGSMHHKQDIIIPLNPRRILIFKQLGTDIGEGIGAYKSVLYEYIAAVNKIPALCAADHRFYAGSIQNSLDYYKYSFQHTLWLAGHADSGQGNAFLYYDHIQEYMESRIDFLEYVHVFQIYQSLFEEEDREMFIHTVSSLFENNMNLAKTASTIFVHRNTLNFRLNKIKDLLNVDPVNNNESRELLRQLLHFYKGLK